MKSASIISLLIISCLVVLLYQNIHTYSSLFNRNIAQAIIHLRKEQFSSNQSYNDSLTFQRRTHCNYKSKAMCYSTNKSLLVTFWSKKSSEKWVSQNILQAFPLHSFDHIIFVHDNSTWQKHPDYQHFIWIHVQGQLRFWYLKRFILPNIADTYEYLWIIDDDAQLNFHPLQYQCVIKNLSIHLSAPARLTGIISHPLTKKDTSFSNRIGRWTDFIETGPIVVASTFAWKHIHMYLDPSTGTGWGLDLIWCNMIAEYSLLLFKRTNVCAILDAFGVDHQSTRVNSLVDGGFETPIYMRTFRTWLARKVNIAPLATDNKLLELCHQ